MELSVMETEIRRSSEEVGMLYPERRQSSQKKDNGK
jgi:hypothetical protein